MNRVLFVISSLLLSSIVSAADKPIHCNGQEIDESDFLAGLSMPIENYNITRMSDGEIYYLKVSVPATYEGLDIKQINFKRIISDKPTINVGLAHQIKSDVAETTSILISPSEIESIGFNAFYALSQECHEGYSYFKKSRTYDLVYKHNKVKNSHSLRSFGLHKGSPFVGRYVGR